MANEQEIGKLVVRLVAEVKGIKTGLTEAQKSIKDFSEQGKKHTQDFKNGLAGIQMAYLQVAAVAYATYRTILKTMDWAKIGAQAQQVEQSFESLTKSLGINGRVLIDEMKKVSGVWVEETEVMIKAQRLLAEGVSAKDLIDLTQASRIAAKMMGVEVSEAFGRVSEAVITLKTRGLKAAFPMDVTEVTEKYARSLGTVAKYLNETGQRQAILNEIVRQSIDKQKLLGNTLDPNNYDKVQKFQSAITQLKEEIGKLVADAVVPLIDNLITLGKNLETSTPGVIKYAREWFLMSTPTGGLGQAYILFKKISELFGKFKTPELPSEARFTAGFKAQRDALARAEEEEKLKGKSGIDQRKLDEDLEKFRLANEEQRIAALNDLNRSGLEARRAMELAEAKRTSEDVTVLEMTWDKRMAQEELRATKEILDTKQKAEVKAAKEGGMDVANVNKKFLALNLAAQGKYASEVAKIDARLIQEREEALRKSGQIQFGFTPEEQPFAPTLEQTAEMDKRSVDVMIERDKWQAEYIIQLGEVMGDYEAITEAQVRSLEVERTAFKEGDIYGKLSLDQQKAYNDLIDLRILKLRETRKLENLQDIAAWRKEIGELTGNWVMMKGAEIDALNVQKDYLLTTKALTPAMRDYIEELYKLKIAEMEAKKSMDVFALTNIGLSKYSISLNDQLVNQYENLIPNSIDMIGNAFVNAAMNGENFFASLKMGFKRLLMDIMATILKMQIMNLLFGKTGTGTGLIGSIIRIIGGWFSGTTSTGFSIGGTVGRYQHGGQIVGPSGVDVVPINATAGEFVEPVSAVRYYGESVMEAIRQQLIPRSSLFPFAEGYAEGGRVQVGRGESMIVNVPVNINDPRLASHLRSSIEDVVIRTLKEFSR